MMPRSYEIVFLGEAVPAVVEAFEDFDVTVGSGCTVLRAELPDAAALHGTLDRLRDLGLELVGVKVIDPEPAQTVHPATGEDPTPTSPYHAR